MGNLYYERLPLCLKHSLVVERRAPCLPLPAWLNCTIQRAWLWPWLWPWGPGGPSNGPWLYGPDCGHGYGLVQDNA